MVLMEIMKPLKKLSSKFGGLIKLAVGSVPGLNWQTGELASAPAYGNTSIASTSSSLGDVGSYGNLTEDQYDDLSQDDREFYALDRAGRIGLDEPEYHEYEKLPEYVLGRTFNPYTRPGNILQGDGNAIKNRFNGNQSLNQYIDSQDKNVNSYMQNPVGPYQQLPGGMDPTQYQSPIIRNNSMSSGREGVVSQSTGGNPNLPYVNNPTARSVDRREMEYLNSQYLYKKPGSGGDDATPHNTTGALRQGPNKMMFTDPVVNRRSQMSDYLNSRKPQDFTNLVPDEDSRRSTGELGSRQQIRESIEGGPVLSVPPAPTNKSTSTNPYMNLRKVN